MKTLYRSLAALTFLFCFLASSGAQTSQQITLTLAAKGNVYLYVTATKDKPFIVNWGDGSSDVYLGQGVEESYCSHDFSSTINTLKVVISGNSTDCNLTALSYYGNNMNQLDLSQAPELKTLNCSANQLTTLDVSKNIALLTLNCGGNKLKELDVSKNIALQSMDCSYNKLTSLDISLNVNLNTIFCTDNSLDSINVSPLTLYGLYTNNNFLSLKTLYNLSLAFSKNGGGCFFGTQHIPLSFSLHAGETLDVKPYELEHGINTLSVTLNGLPAQKGTDYSEESEKITFHSKGIYEVSITNNFLLSSSYDPTKLVLNVLVDPTSKILTLTYTIDTKIPNPYYRQIGIGATPSTGITIDWGDQTSNTYLTPENGAEIICKKTYSQTGSYTATITSVGDITSLYCSGLNITTLDLSSCKALKEIYCSGNLFTDIDLSGCTALENFDCPYSMITNLNVSKNASLKILDCMFSKLTSIDIGDNKNMQWIYLTNNALPLNELYALSINEPTAHKNFGLQTLATRLVAGNDELDLTNQAILGTTSTLFTIKKGNIPAVENTDYTLVAGKLTFLTIGYFTVTMTNVALPTDQSDPTQVIASYTVLATGLNDPSHTALKVYPNPTKGIVYIENDNAILPEAIISSMKGDILLHKKGTSIDFSPLKNGIYFMQVNGKTIKVVKN